MSSCVLAVCLYTATMELAELYGYNSHITLSTAFTLSITQASAEGYKTIKRIAGTWLYLKSLYHVLTDSFK